MKNQNIETLNSEINSEEHNLEMQLAFSIHPMKLSKEEKAFVQDQFDYYKENYGIKTIVSEYTGGGCWHLLFHLMNDHIVNITDGSAETSWYAYKHISEYFNSDFGFGYESENPHYEVRYTYKLGQWGNNTALKGASRYDKGGWKLCNK